MKGSLAGAVDSSVTKTSKAQERQGAKKASKKPLCWKIGTIEPFDYTDAGNSS